MLSAFRQDLAYAVRQIRRQPGFALVIVLTLGSAMGIGTSLFAVFNATVFRPWPARDPKRVVVVDTRYGFSLAEWRHLSQEARSVTGIVAETDGLRTNVGEQRLRFQHVSANYFTVLGVPMELGQSFTPADDEPNAAPRAVLGYGCWRALGGDPAIIGRSLELEGVPFTVIGVASRHWSRRVFGPTDVWVSMATVRTLTPQTPADYRDDPKLSSWRLAARLAPGTTAGEAQAELATLSQRFRAGHPVRKEPLRVIGTAAADGMSALEYTRVVGALSLPVLLILLLACANAGNLLLARAYSRRRETAVRLALGAGRGRLVRQLLTESLLFAGLAGLLGFALAAVLPNALVAAWVPPEIPFTGFALDHRVLFFSLGLSTVTCIAFGLAPALHCTRVSVGGALKDVFGLPRQKLEMGLLRIQVAICVVLLAAAGLLLRGVQHAQTKDLGFDAQGITMLRFELPRRYDDAQRRVFAVQMQAEIDELGPRRGVAATGKLLLDATIRWTRVAEAGLTHKVETSPRYFELLGIPLVAGRMFDSADVEAPVAIVNERLARALAPGGSALGREVRWDEDRWHVIGIVRDADVARLDRSLPTLFVPLRPGTLPGVLIRDQLAPGAAAAVKSIATRLGPDVRIRSSSLSTFIDGRLAGPRMAAWVAGILGVLGLLLASLGIAGAFAFAVQQRTREIGVRTALGAGAAQVLRAVLGPSARALAAGLVVGVLGAAGVGRFLRNQLHGLSPLDPLAIGGVALVLAMAAVAASYVPARRALRVDPTVALRYE